MRRPPVLLTMALLLSAAVFAHAADDFVLSRFTDYLDALRTQAGIPGLAAAIVGPGSVIWEGAFGQQDVEHNIAARLDTPFELDGTTQAVAASLAVRCSSDGWLSLDDPVAKFVPSSPEAGATIRQLLTHTSAGPQGLTFSYRPDRLGPVAPAIGSCTDSSYRWGLSNLLYERLAMHDTVPGSDAAQMAPGTERFDAATLARFVDVLRRLAVPYAVDASRHATRSSYVATTLTPASGLISTVIDLEKFDLALKGGSVVRPLDALAASWTPPNDASGRPLPHADGWFVQTSNGERIVWQFGVSDNASSSMILMLPRRGLTLILLANSSGLSRPFSLAGGDVTVSPFARLFMSIFTR
jgi:CubicO group peptidase (beta-lactamase class C family)